MLYCALVKDELCPRALYVLVGYMAKFFAIEPALALGEFALSKIPADDDYVRILKKEMKQIAENSPFIEPILDPRVTPPFDAADMHKFVLACRTFVGHRSQSLVHNVTGSADLWDRFDEYNHPENFHETEEYQEFLKSREGRADDYVERPPRPEHEYQRFDPDNI